MYSVKVNNRTKVKCMALNFNPLLVDGIYGIHSIEYSKEIEFKLEKTVNDV